MRLISLLSSLAIVIGVAVEGHAQDQKMEPDVFYAHLKRVLDTKAAFASPGETAILLNRMAPGNDKPLAPGDARTYCYLDFGNVDRFISLAKRGTNAVVVDPGYLRDAGLTDTLAIYQNVNGMSRVIQGLDARYKGHIILQASMAAPGTSAAADSTLIHEALHAAAFALDRTDLDIDGAGYDAPEYLSGTFFEHQQRLLRMEAAAWREVLPHMQRIVAVQQSGASDDEIAAETSARIRDIWFIASNYLQELEEYYQSEVVDNIMAFNYAYAHELAVHWDGKVDWDGLLRDTRANVAFLQTLGSSIAGGGKLAEGPSQNFIAFMFQKPCKAR